MEDKDSLLPGAVLFTETPEEKKLNSDLEILNQSVINYIHRTHQEIDARDKEIEGLKDRLASEEREHHDVKQRFEVLQQDHNNLEIARENCEKSRLRVDQENRDLREELDRTKNSLRAMEGIRKENESLKEERYVLLQEIESLRSEIKKIEGLNSGKVEELQNQFLQERNRMQDIQCSLEDKIRHLNELNTEEALSRERLGREKKQVVDEMERINGEKKEMREQFSRQLSLLQDQLKSSEKRAQENLRDLEQKARKELVDLEREKSSRIAVLEKELNQKQREMSLKEHQIAQMESEHSRKLELSKKEFESRLSVELDDIKRKYYFELEKARKGGRWTGDQEDS
nr:hypothetical protein [uncultured Dethiosulfovibrio sp.]